MFPAGERLSYHGLWKKKGMALEDYLMLSPVVILTMFLRDYRQIALFFAKVPDSFPLLARFPVFTCQDNKKKDGGW